jgi:hypothetical protein
LWQEGRRQKGPFGRSVGERAHPRSLPTSGLPGNRFFILPKRQMISRPFIGPVMKDGHPYIHFSVSCLDADLIMTVSSSTFPIAPTNLHHLPLPRSHTPSPRSSTTTTTYLPAVCPPAFPQHITLPHSLVHISEVFTPAGADPFRETDLRISESRQTMI